MAISRAQLAKELEPGLNALFGMEYTRYEGQHAEIFDTESSDRAFEEEVMLSGFGAAPVKGEGTGVTFDDANEAYTARYNHETVAMAFLGTILGLIIAFPISFLGAKNITRIFWVRHTARRGYDIIRAFETLILALIFIRAFGLGPLAGVLAIAVSEIGTFGKLFSEALENTSKRPVEGVVASGGSRLQAIYFGIMPQVLPVHLSIILYNFESNVRSSTILGIVGAGGIGFMLSDRIAGLFWDQVWTIIFLIIAMVYVVDYLSALIRTRLIGKADLAK